MRSLGIADDTSIVLAVSGGPDSMALLRGATRLVETGARAWQLTVAHLDHGLRAGSADDATFVTHAAAVFSGRGTASRRRSAPPSASGKSAG
jgi:tRNA(Ile)-lysidine synthase